MRKFLLLLPLLFVAACADKKAPAIRADLPVTRLTERVYVLHGPNELPNKHNQGFMNNPGFVLTKKGVVVIDPGASVRVGELVLKKISGVTPDPVIAVFNTHVHGDHWLGNQAIKAAYPKAVIYAHDRMKTKAQTEGDRWIKLLDRMTEGALRGTRPVAPDTVVHHDETLTLGGMHFRFYHSGQAHTDGDLMIEVVEEKAMFLGDIVLAGRIPPMNDGHFLGNIRVIDLALESGAVHFVPGHGPSGGREVPRAYREYLAELTAAVKRHHDQGLADFEMKPKVAEALARFKTWKHFDDELGRHVGLAALQAEAEGF
jgi:glyoxylase-like metal-dependent hydrolase (beta-lactamase superfamily II)